MPIEGRALRIAETRERLLRSALTLFVARGIAETSTREIALAAGIAEGTIYRHFPSKEDLAWELFSTFHVALAKRLDAAARRHPDLRSKIRAFIGAYCEMADADFLAFSYHVLSMHQHLPKLRSEMPNPMAVIRKAVAAGMQQGEIPQRDPELAAAMALGIFLQPAVHRIYGDLDIRLADHAETFADAIWRTLTT